jgi:Uma2 family endonuclease
MATSTLVPLEEYLSTCYEPDCEYVDGELVERFVGEHDHSRLQMMIAAYFYVREAELNIKTFPEQRVRVASTESGKRYRIPDVCVVRMPYAKETVLSQPPYLAVEILSPDDRAGDTLQKASEYARFGIPHIWIVDPRERKLFHADSDGIHEVGDLVGRLPELGLSVDFNPFFDKL